MVVSPHQLSTRAREIDLLGWWEERLGGVMLATVLMRKRLWWMGMWGGRGSAESGLNGRVEGGGELKEEGMRVKRVTVRSIG